MSRTEEFDRLVTAKLSSVFEEFEFTSEPAPRSETGPRYYKDFKRNDMVATVSYEPYENHVEIRIRRVGETGIGYSRGYELMRPGRPFAEFFPNSLASVDCWIDGFAKLLQSEGAAVFATNNKRLSLMLERRVHAFVPTYSML